MTLRTAPPTLAQIQAPIRGRLDHVMEELRRIVAADFGAIEEVNDYLFQVRGKLFRPSLLLLSEEVSGSASPKGLTLAAVVELIHLATLVHDDAVDHSVLRRGMPTVNALWSHQVSIIMGDYLYSRSLTEISRLGDVEPVRILAEASNAMSVGEMRQLVSHDALDFGEPEYFRLIECKTASLISAACELGAMAGRTEHRAALARFGMELGMAFQIVDDLLDYTSDESVTGKPTGLDLREHKVTLPLIAVLPHLSPGERAQVEALFRQPEPADEEIAAIVHIVGERGGLDYARERALEFASRAAEALEDLPGGPALDSLRESITYVIERQH
jgi:octaprenyl-diphosphate synthase